MLELLSALLIERLGSDWWFDTSHEFSKDGAEGCLRLISGER